MKLSVDSDSGIGINLSLVAAVLRDKADPHRSRIILVSGFNVLIDMPFSEAVAFLSGKGDEGCLEKEISPAAERVVSNDKPKDIPLECDGRAGSGIAN